MALWIRLPIFPLSRFNTDFLMELGNKFGKVLRVDETTFIASHGKFSKISIEVDLNKLLRSKFQL